MVAITLWEALVTKAKNIYETSAFYSPSIFVHALETSQKATEMAKLAGANIDVCQVAGLLHHIGAAKYGRANHHRTGAKMAGEILRSFFCQEDFIGAVQECVLVHRGSLRKERRTKEAKIVASADALSHFGKVDELLEVARDNLGLNPGASQKWLRAKLRRDWARLTPEARSMAQKTYDLAMASIA